MKDLSKSNNAQDLIDSHREAIAFHTEGYNKRVSNYEAVSGNTWSYEEKEQAKEKKKVLVSYNQLKPQERAILGYFIRSGWDMKLTPTEHADETLAQALESLRVWENKQQKITYKDVEIFREAWIAGTGFQECLPVLETGEKNRIQSNNLNAFNVAWDPESRIPISHEDARFVDVDSWATLEELQEAYPEHSESLEERLSTVNDTNTFERREKYKDRDAQNRNERNGLFKVTERYYKCRKPEHTAFNGQEWVTLTDDEVQLAKDMGFQVKKKMKDFLYLATVCASWSNNKFLYNGRLYTQPRKPDGTIVWPILELSAESLNGQSFGFVDFAKEPNKIFSALMTAVVESAKNASSQSMFGDPTAFVNEKEYQDFKKHRASANRTFDVKPGRLDAAAAPVPKSQVTYDTYEGLRLTQDHLEKVGSAPPAMMGYKRGETSGTLNNQMIEQAETQLQVLFLNYKHFLEQRYYLWLSYWKQHYNDEMVIRLLNPVTGDEEVLNFNVQQQDLDQYGFPSGGFSLLNNLETIEFDVNIEESQRSTTHRAKVQNQIVDLLQSNAIAQDPNLVGYLTQSYIEMSDLPVELKRKTREHNSVIQQNTEEAKQAQQAQAQAEQERNQADIQKKMAEIEKVIAEAQLIASKTRTEDTEAEGAMTEAEKSAISVIREQLAVLKDKQELRKNELEIMSVKQGVAAEEVRPEFEMQASLLENAREDVRLGKTVK